MQVKIKDNLYTVEDGPIMLILNDSDKRRLAALGDNIKICYYLDKHFNSEADVIAWMAQTSV